MDKIQKDIPLIDAIGNGVVIYSKVTDIFYKTEGRKLMKAATHRSSFEWETSDFSGTWKAGMSISSEKELLRRKKAYYG